MTQPIPVLLLLGAVGACLGSFACTAALRFARQEQYLLGRSHCDHCGRGLGWQETIPFVSFALTAGSCPTCRGRIDPVHIVGEFAGAVIVASAFALLPPLRAALVAAIGLLLLCDAVIDRQTQRLPDALSMAMIALTLSLAAMRSPTAALVGLAWSAGAFVVFEVIRRSFRALRGKEGLGSGDVKLVAALAPWLGPLTPMGVAVASALGLAIVLATRPQGGRIAFGPAIAVGAWSTGLVGEALNWSPWG